MGIEVTVNLDDETRRKLDELAERTERSASSLIKDAVRQYIDHEQWMFDRIEDGVAAAERGELHSHDAVMAEIETMIEKRLSRDAKP